MKKLKRILTAFLGAVMLAALLTGCGSETSSQIEARHQAEIREANLEKVKEYTEQLAVLLSTYSYEEFESVASSGSVAIGNEIFTNDLSNRWKQFADAHGKVTETLVQEAEREETDYVDRIILTGEDEGQMLLTITYDRTMAPVSTAIQDYSDDSEASFGSKMATAGSNTLTGILVVFVILVGLSLIISCFRFIGNIGEVKPEKKDAPKAAPAPAPKAAPAPAAAPAQDLMKDQELVAVIMAAIAASEEKPVEGYVVRSIKRLNNNKWR